MIEILLPGEKVKRKRKELKMTQSDVAQTISRSVTSISLIEKGTISLASDTAEEISKCFNEKILSENLDIQEVNANYLLEDVSTQLEKEINKFENYIFLNSKCNIEKIENKISEINNLVDMYKDKIKSEIRMSLYKSISEFYMQHHEWKKSKLYNNYGSLNAIENQNPYEVIEIYLQLTRINLREQNYEELIANSNHAVLYFTTQKILNEDCKKIYFNLAKAYSYNEDYKECMDILTLIKSNFRLNYNEQIDVDILMANMKYNLGNLKEAKDEYLKILNRACYSKDRYTIAILYRNLTEVSYYLDEKEKGREYLELLNAEEFVGSEFDITTRKYSDMKMNVLYENSMYVMESYKKTLRLVIDSKSKNMQRSYCNKIIDFFINKGEKAELKIFLKLIGDSVEKITFNPGRIFFKSLQLFNSNELEEIYNYQLDILNQIEKNNDNFEGIY